MFAGKKRAKRTGTNEVASYSPDISAVSWVGDLIKLTGTAEERKELSVEHDTQYAVHTLYCIHQLVGRPQSIHTQKASTFIRQANQTMPIMLQTCDSFLETNMDTNKNKTKRISVDHFEFALESVNCVRDTIRGPRRERTKWKTEQQTIWSNETFRWMFDNFFVCFPYKFPHINLVQIFVIFRLIWRFVLRGGQ